MTARKNDSLTRTCSEATHGRQAYGRTHAGARPGWMRVRRSSWGPQVWASGARTHALLASPFPGCGSCSPLLARQRSCTLCRNLIVQRGTPCCTNRLVVVSVIRARGRFASIVGFLEAGVCTSVSSKSSDVCGTSWCVPSLWQFHHSARQWYALGQASESSNSYK